MILFGEKGTQQNYLLPGTENGKRIFSTWKREKFIKFNVQNSISFGPRKINFLPFYL